MFPLYPAVLIAEVLSPSFPLAIGSICICGFRRHQLQEREAIKNLLAFLFLFFLRFTANPHSLDALPCLVWRLDATSRFVCF
jgi:hypothetical protein